MALPMQRFILNTAIKLSPSNTRFINARRRIVQPMIDQSNRAGPSAGGFSPDGAMGYMMDGSAQMMAAHRGPADPAFHNEYYAAAHAQQYYGHL